MLKQLVIRNIVLIDHLTLEGDTGLSTLTGETGAGKSILLDALGLALGGRSEARLVRHGEKEASVTASFEIPKKHPVLALLKEKDIETSDTLILRRTLKEDGRSKAFINDAPITIQFLRDVGRQLIEIHGQFETQGLLNTDTHGSLLDQYAGLTKDVSKLNTHWQKWKDARLALEKAKNDIEISRQQEDYLKYTVKELEKLDPQEGEEDILAEKRRFLLNKEKIKDGIQAASHILQREEGIQDGLGKLENTISRLQDHIGNEAKPLIEALHRAKSEIDDLSYQIDLLGKGGVHGNEKLEDIEDRYFALRECAKKHRCTSDDLAKLYEDLSRKLNLITNQEGSLLDLEKEVSATKNIFIKESKELNIKRQKAAKKISKAVNAELPDLKLDRAIFYVDCTLQEDEKKWNKEGMDKVEFTVSTNTNTPSGPLHKIASGGELSRLMLALKLILAETGSIPTLVFDEVDSGIGGATANAVGERLEKLSKQYQVFAVTHSPQVAARATHHWIVAKTEQKGTVITKVLPLKELSDRQEEIARMLSGAKITTEARAAAAKLLENHVA